MPGLMIMMLLAASVVPAAPMTPTDKWNLEYDPDMCVISRPFGTAPDNVVFAVNPAIDMTSRASILFFIVPDTKHKEPRFGTAKLVLQPSGKVISFDYASGAIEGGRRAYKINANPLEMDEIVASSAITFAGDSHTFALAVGDMPHVMTALRACNRDLFKFWGVNPDALAEAVGHPYMWFSNNDYPREARFQNAQGRVTILIKVKPDGKPADCRVAVSSGSALLDETSCRVATSRGKYVPSLGPGDRYSVLSIRWQL